MLGKTASGLFWMNRYLERCENTARLADAGFRIALTRADQQADEWASVAATAGVLDAYQGLYESFETTGVIDFLLRNDANPSSLLASAKAARENARLVRTAVTREMWEAVNECWLTLSDLLAEPVLERDLPEVLATIRRQTSLVRGAWHGTMMRTDPFNFAMLGTFVERADNTARLLDVKYYVLLPSISHVGTSLDFVQWESILRALSAQSAYRWLNNDDASPIGIANFLIFDQRVPRSLAFCYANLGLHLDRIEAAYGERKGCHDLAEDINLLLNTTDITAIFESGLHEFLGEFISGNSALAAQIEDDYRFLA